VPILLADMNYLQRPELISFVARSRSNKVAIAAETLVEAHKREPKLTIEKCFRGLRDHPDQVLILHGAPTCYAGPMKSARDVRGIISEAQSNDFPTWYDQVCGGVLDDLMEAKQAEAQATIEAIRAQVADMEPTFQQMRRHFTDEERKTIRSNKPAGAATQGKLVELMYEISRVMFRVNGVPAECQPQIRYQAFDYFVFRYSMCMILLYVRWLQEGNLSANPDRLVNHVIDMHVAALATYFGGILTRDAMLSDTHRIARKLLRLSGHAYVG